MLLEEFDVKKYEKSLRAEGIEQGMEQGRQEGTKRANKLTVILLEKNRIADLEKAARDEAYQEQLFREFNL